MAPKPKQAPRYQPLLTIQTGFEGIIAKAMDDAVGIKMTVKRQPLCLEAIEILDSLDRAATGLLQLTNAYRKELADLANEDRHHA